MEIAMIYWAMYCVLDTELYIWSRSLKNSKTTPQEMSSYSCFTNEKTKVQRDWEIYSR